MATLKKMLLGESEGITNDTDKALADELESKDKKKPETEADEIADKMTDVANDSDSDSAEALIPELKQKQSDQIENLINEYPERYADNRDMLNALRHAMEQEEEEYTRLSEHGDGKNSTSYKKMQCIKRAVMFYTVHYDRFLKGDLVLDDCLTSGEASELREIGIDVKYRDLLQMNQRNPNSTKPDVIPEDQKLPGPENNTREDVASSTEEVGDKIDEVVREEDLLPGSDFMQQSEKRGDVSLTSLNSSKTDDKGRAPIKLNTNVPFTDPEIDNKVLKKGLTEKINLLLQSRESAGKDFDMNRKIEDEIDKSKDESKVVQKLVQDTIEPVTEKAIELLGKNKPQNVEQMQDIAREIDMLQNDIIVEKIELQHDEDNRKSEKLDADTERINPYYRIKSNRLPGSVREVLDRNERLVNHNAMRIAVDYKMQADSKMIQEQMQNLD